jgi:hypothetical protein
MANTVRVAAFAARAAGVPVRVVAHRLDRYVVPDAAGTLRMRQALAALVFVYAFVLALRAVAEAEVPSPAALLIMVLAAALYLNRGGRILRDWGLVFLALVAYAAAAAAVPDLGLRVHFAPQLEADRLLGFGHVPTLWLQEHLYDGTAGWLEVFSIVMYLSHFVAPVVLASLIWLYWPGRGFGELFFGILAVSILGEITYLVAPTAPPWMAGDEGLIPQVHHVIKEGLVDLGLPSVAARKDDPSSYNVVAAWPSLHAAWPVIALLAIRKHRLPQWLFCSQLALCAGVFFAVVYTGDHYVADVLGGVAYAFVAWWLVGRLLTLGRPAIEPAGVKVAAGRADV